MVIADFENHVIRKIDLDQLGQHKVSTLAGVRHGQSGHTFRDGDAMSALFHFPSGVSVAPAQGSAAGGSAKVAVADSLNNAIRIITMSTSSVDVSTLVGSRCEPGNVAFVLLSAC